MPTDRPDTPRLLQLPPDDNDVQAARRWARAVVQTGKAAASPTIDPPHAVSGYWMPCAYSDAWMPLLPPSAQIALVQLVRIQARYTGGLFNRWFFHDDNRLQAQSALSPRSLLRSRNALRDRGLLFATTATTHRTPTHYLLRWPPPMPLAEPGVTPDAKTRAAMMTVAAEIRHNGAPLDPLVAWSTLCIKLAAETGREWSQTLIAARARGNLRAVARSLRRLAADTPTGPWLVSQLSWADPQLDPAAVALHAT